MLEPGNLPRVVKRQELCSSRGNTAPTDSCPLLQTGCLLNIQEGSEGPSALSVVWEKQQ